MRQKGQFASFLKVTKFRVQGGRAVDSGLGFRVKAHLCLI
jgi:hypothetical protein